MAVLPSVLIIVFLVNAASAMDDLPFVSMLRICKISGQELPTLNIQNISDIRDLKRELRDRHSFPVCLQQLLHKGISLDDLTKLELLQDGSRLDDSAPPDSLDASIHLQLVLSTASTDAELEETTELFRVACWRGDLRI